MKSTIGLKNLVGALITEDKDGGQTTYGPVFKIAGVIDAQITPDETDSDVQYAEDVEWDAVPADGAYTVEIETAGINPAMMAKLQGHKLDNKGGVIVATGDEAPYLALGFKSAISGAEGGYRYVWIFKCRAEAFGQTYHSKEGNKVIRQTAKLKFKSIARTSDGKKQYVLDNAEETFFDAPVNPVAVGD